MANQVHVMSESMSSSECGTFQTTSMSFVVIDDNMPSDDRSDSDISEDESLQMIESLTQRVKQMGDALTEGNDSEVEDFRRRIRHLEKEKAEMESNITRLEREIKETKNSTMTSMSASAYPDTLWDQLTLENSDLKKQLEEASSSSKMFKTVQNKKKELKEKEQEISALKKEKEDMESNYMKELENANIERRRLQEQIDVCGTASSDVQDLQEKLREKIKELEELQNEKEETELLLEEQIKDSERLQEQVKELESRGTGSGTMSGDLRAKQEEIAKLQKDKKDLESSLLVEKEASKEQKKYFEDRILEMTRSRPIDNGKLSTEKEELRQKCESLENQLADIEKEYEDRLKDLQDSGPLRQQLSDLDKRHQEELENLRVNHEEVIKEQQARAKTEINQLKRELSSFKRNATPEGQVRSEELVELREANKRLEAKLEEYEIKNNKLAKKKEELFEVTRTLRTEKAKLETELRCQQRNIADRQTADRIPTDEVDRLRESVEKRTKERDELQRLVENLRRELAERLRGNTPAQKPSKDLDEIQPILEQIHKTLLDSSSNFMRRKEEKNEKKGPRGVTESILRLAANLARSGREQSHLLDIALKEKEFAITKREEAESKLTDGLLRASDKLNEALRQAQHQLEAQSAEHANHQQKFIDFLQTRLELVTSPAYDQRMQPIPIYNGCSHFVGQPLPPP